MESNVKYSEDIVPISDLKVNPGRIVERSHELIIRLVKGHPAMDL